MSTSRTAVSIKGTKTGLQIVVDDTIPFDEVFRQLAARLDATDTFFQGSRVAMDIGDRMVTTEQWTRLDDQLRQRSLVLTAVLAAQDQSRTAARALGIPLVMDSRRDASGERRYTRTDAEGNSEGLFIRHTLRSGQVVRYPGSIMVMGDVNSGAQIVADGDIIVWGSLRGMVHAGASGDEKATVCALQLGPTQLRLAGHIARSPANRPLLVNTPEVASLKGGDIVLEEWLSARQPANRGLSALLVLAAVCSLEAIGLAVAIQELAVPWWSPYVPAIVVVAVVLGWLLSLLVASRRDHI